MLLCSLAAGRSAVREVATCVRAEAGAGLTAAGARLLQRETDWSQQRWQPATAPGEADGLWSAAACAGPAAAASAVGQPCRPGAGPSQQLEAAGATSLRTLGAASGEGTAGDAAVLAAKAFGQEAAACGPAAEGDRAAAAANPPRRGRDVMSPSWWQALDRRRATTQRASPSRWVLGERR